VKQVGRYHLQRIDDDEHDKLHMLAGYKQRNLKFMMTTLMTMMIIGVDQS